MLGLKQTGFTVIELAMILIIIAAILGGLIMPLNTQIDSSRIAATERNLAQIKEALLNYVANTNNLPCPTVLNSTNGLPASSLCDQEGGVPWGQLGTPRYDAWGREFRYRAVNQLTNTYLSVVIENKTATGFTSINNTAVVVIFSLGKNGIADGDVTADNGNSGNPYRQGTTVFSSTNYFDDRLMWISEPQVITRMTRFGKRWNGLQATPI